MTMHPIITININFHTLQVPANSPTFASPTLQVPANSPILAFFRSQAPANSPIFRPNFSPAQIRTQPQLLGESFLLPESAMSQRESSEKKSYTSTTTSFPIHSAIFANLILKS